MNDEDIEDLLWRFVHDADDKKVISMIWGNEWHLKIIHDFIKEWVHVDWNLKKGIKEMIGWIKCEEELPSCDGKYLICNSLDDVTIAKYDGCGFKLDLKDCRYFNPRYWKNYEEPQKKYGKQK